MSHPDPKSLLPGGDGDMYLRGRLRIIHLLLQVYKDHRRWADMEHRNLAKFLFRKTSICFSEAVA